MVFSEYAKISLDMLRIPQGLIFCIFYKNLLFFHEFHRCIADGDKIHSFGQG